MSSISQQALLDAGVHFGHLKRKWNPKMLPYIYAERKGIHIIDLNKTSRQMEHVANILRNMARSGKTILFVATKKHAKQVVAGCAMRAGVPYVTERWLGGMLTNYSTIKESIKKIKSIEHKLADGTLDNITKKERLQMQRSKEKMEKVLGGIMSNTKTPHMLVLVDIGHEHLALAEAKKLRIQTVGIVDTNCDPNLVNHAIPANDDSSKSISLIMNYLTDAIIEGHNERKNEREMQSKEVAAVVADDSEKKIRLKDEHKKDEEAK